MQTTRERIIYWLRAAVVLCVSVALLAAAPPDSGATSSTAANDSAERHLSKHGGSCRVCYHDKMITFDTKAGQNYRLNGELEIPNSK